MDKKATTPKAYDLELKNTKSVTVPNTIQGWKNVNQLASDASTGEPHAGGTMNVNNWHLARPGEDLVFVGGHPDTSGNRIETAYEGGGSATPRISPLSVLQHAQRIRDLTGAHPKANMGLWVNPEIGTNKRGIDVDASTGVATEGEAVELMKTRPSEEGAWSMKLMAERNGDGFIPNEAYDPNTKKPSY